MEAKMGAAQSYMNNFEPLSDVIREDECDTLLIYLPGFLKEHLKVQLASSGYLRISGLRPLGDNRTSSFQKDFPISHDCDKTKITAKFEGGILYVRQPKLITAREEKQQTMLSQPPSDTTKPQIKPNGGDKDVASSSQVKKENQEQEIIAPKKPRNDDQIEKSSSAKEAEPKKEEGKGAEHEKMGSMKDDQIRSHATSSGNKGSVVAKVMNGGSTSSAAERLKRARKKMNMVMALVCAFVLGLYVSNLVWRNKKDD